MPRQLKMFELEEAAFWRSLRELNRRRSDVGTNIACLTAYEEYVSLESAPRGVMSPHEEPGGSII